MTTQQWSINAYRSTFFQRVNKLRSTSWSLKENKSQRVSELLIQTAKRSASGLVYRLICTRPFHHASISINNWSCVYTGIVWREIAQNWFEVVHTHQTSFRSSWPRGFAELNPSPHSWILFYLSLSGFQSLLLLIHFCGSQYLFTEHQSLAHNLSDKWHNAQLPTVIEIAPKLLFLTL